MKKLQTIAEQFMLEGTILSIQPFGSGHINTTYKIETVDPHTPNYVLQKINHTIFTRPDKLQENIIRVTEHLSTKKKLPLHQQLKVIYTHDGAPYLHTSDGEYWRIYTCVEETLSYNLITNPKQAYEGGKAFGAFMSQLADLPGGPVFDIIENFHNVQWRLENFEAAVKQNSAGRANQVQDLIHLVRSRADEMQQILKLGQAGKLPVRITHNDTKFNNILFNKQNEAICIVDLDTVMNGYVHYDFGDSIRTATNTGEEDDINLNNISMDIHLFEAFTQGYLEETSEVLTALEINYLPAAAAMITYIMALRFLTDYLDGDHYYKINHPEHNLQRARAQFKLLRSIDEQMDEMNRIVQQKTTFTIPLFPNLSTTTNLTEIQHQLIEKGHLFHVNKINWQSFPNATPQTSVHFAVAKDAFLLHFSVTENQLKAEKTKINQEVYEDSCVEFFISPQSNQSYYNFEFNALGTCLAGFGAKPDRTRLPENSIQTIQTAGTYVGQPPFSEQQGKLSWQLTVVIPFSILNIENTQTLQFTANFYKCGDQLSQPHYLSLFPITTPSPNFHQPLFFRKFVAS